MAIFAPTNRLLIDYLSMMTREGFTWFTLPTRIKKRPEGFPGSFMTP